MVTFWRAAVMLYSASIAQMSSVVCLFVFPSVVDLLWLNDTRYGPRSSLLITNRKLHDGF